MSFHLKARLLSFMENREAHIFSGILSICLLFFIIDFMFISFSIYEALFKFILLWVNINPALHNSKEK